MQRWRRIVRINFLLTLACRKSNIPETVSGDRLRGTIDHHHDWSISSSDNLPFPSIIVFSLPPPLSLSLLSFIIFSSTQSDEEGRSILSNDPSNRNSIPRCYIDAKSKGEKAICSWWWRGSVDNRRRIKSFEIKRLLYGNPRLETVF